MRLALPPHRVRLLGTALVLALVVLQPIALGFFPVAQLGTTHRAHRGANDTHDIAQTAVIGTGDMTAGALSALVRDLNTEGATPPHARSVSPVVLVLLADVDPDATQRRRGATALPDFPPSPRAGASGHGYPLLL